MRSERDKWEEKYKTKDFSHDGPPSGLLMRWLPKLPKGRALEVATGLGRNALALAAAGYRVDAIDISPTGLAEAARRARRRSLEVNWIEADLDVYPLPRARYDVVVSTFFLKRRLWPALRAALKPGGVIVFETHLLSPDEQDGPTRKRHRLRPGELQRRFGDWEILDIDEGVFREGERMWSLGRVVARKPMRRRQPRRRRRR
jgi:SAM-dependent methyltransferase